MTDTCAECGKPIEAGQPSWYGKKPSEDIGRSYHSGCGDPFGIKAAIATERKRCARICQDQRASKRPIAAPLTNAAYDEACRDCADAILNG